MGALQAVPVRSKDSILGSNDADVTRPVETDAALSHRGLLNNGANHCFLNVVIQALWHLGPFRTRVITGQGLRTYKENELSEKGAIMDLVKELEQVEKWASPHVPSHMAALPKQTKDDKNTLDTEEFHTAEGEESTPMSTTTEEDQIWEGVGINETLYNLFTQYKFSDVEALPPDELRVQLNRVTGDFKLNEIADANDALSAILESLHREGCDNDKKCLAHHVFGGLLMEQTFCPDCLATSEPQLREDSFLHIVAAAGMVDIARERKSSKKNPLSFGQNLRQSMGLGTKECPSAEEEPPPDIRCKARGDVRTYCLEPPNAVAISVAWTSANSSAGEIESFLGLVSQTVQLGDLFITGSSALADETYAFRGMVLYYGVHYVSVWREYTKPNYLMFDDARVTSRGDWKSVVDSCVRSRYQPVLLLYERTDARNGAGSKEDMEMEKELREKGEVKELKASKESKERKGERREETRSEVAPVI